MTLLKAIALYHERSVVGREDFAELLRLYHFMNFNFREIDESCGTEPSLLPIKEVDSK